MAWCNGSWKIGSFLLILTCSLEVTSAEIITKNMLESRRENHSLVDELNHYRRNERPSTNMVSLIWDQQLADDTERDVVNILNLIGCTAHLDHSADKSWDCNNNDCGDDGDYLRLLMNQPGFHHRTWDTGTDSSEAGEKPPDYLYSYLYSSGQRVSECGHYREYYVADNDGCGTKHTYKLYSYSNRVGCALYKCVDFKSSGAVISTMHFACRFKALKTFRPQTLQHDTSDSTIENRIRLFQPTYSSDESLICSQCPQEAPHCHDNLCTSAADNIIYINVLLLGLIINIITLYLH